MRGGGPVDPVALQNAIKNTEETLGVLNSMVNATPASSASSPAPTPASETHSEAPASETHSDAPASETHSEAHVVTSEAPANPAPTPAESSANVSNTVVSDVKPQDKPARFTVVQQTKGGSSSVKLNLDGATSFNSLFLRQQIQNIKYNVKNLKKPQNDPINRLVNDNTTIPVATYANILNAYLDANPGTSPMVFTSPEPVQDGGTKKRKMRRRRMRTKRRNTMKKRNRSH